LRSDRKNWVNCEKVEGRILKINIVSADNEKGKKTPKRRKHAQWCFYEATINIHTK
jgi:hypothetical protein